MANSCFGNKEDFFIIIISDGFFEIAKRVSFAYLYGVSTENQWLSLVL